jgi:sec-independent protein translocase protein TatA
MTLLFIFDSPTQIIMVIGVVVLLFGAGRLPQLAKSLGQSKKAFREGMREAEEEDWVDKPKDHGMEPPLITSGPAKKPIADMTDEELEAEMARRSEARAEH